MAVIFASMLSGLASVVNNGVSTFSLFWIWDETECPEEML